MLKNYKGFSLVELIIAMLIFVVVMIITSNAFNKIITKSSGMIKSTESQIEGVVGLEMMRRDVAQAGFGLPWSILKTYSSVTSLPSGFPPVTLAQVQSLNDAPSGSPRAIGSLDNLGYGGSDYLSIKSTVIAFNDAAKKSAISNVKSITMSNSSLPFVGTDYVSVIELRFNNYGVVTDHTLRGMGTFANVSSFSGGLRPTESNITYLLYGIDNTYGRAPFNRADYFIYRPTSTTNMPDSCAGLVNSSDNSKGVGILYKAIMNQKNGSFTLYPLLDCVADMQVVYGFDTTTNAQGIVSDHGNDFSKIVPIGASTTDTAIAIRNQLKEVRIFILAQDGKQDKDYNYPNSTIWVGENGYGRLFDFTSSNIKDWNRYHWKIYKIVAQPSL